MSVSPLEPQSPVATVAVHPLAAPIIDALRAIKGASVEERTAAILSLQSFAASGELSAQVFAREEGAEDDGDVGVVFMFDGLSLLITTASWEELMSTSNEALMENADELLAAHLDRGVDDDQSVDEVHAMLLAAQRAEGEHAGRMVVLDGIAGISTPVVVIIGASVGRAFFRIPATDTETSDAIRAFETARGFEIEAQRLADDGKDARARAKYEEALAMAEMLFSEIVAGQPIYFRTGTLIARISVEIGATDRAHELIDELLANGAEEPERGELEQLYIELTHPDVADDIHAATTDPGVTEVPVVAEGASSAAATDS